MNGKAYLSTAAPDHGCGRRHLHLHPVALRHGPERNRRLKLLGRARVLDAREHPDLTDRLAPAPAIRKKVERLVKIEVVAFDWNGPAGITPRYTSAEVEETLGLLQRRLAKLESGR